MMLLMKTGKSWIILVSLGVWFLSPVLAQDAVVTEEALTVVDVSSFGVDPENATHAFQAALDSGADRVWVPKLEHPWVLGPVQLRSNQILEFEEGVEIVALEGAFVPLYSCLFEGRGISNLQIIGNGVVMRMNKPEYQQGEHRKGEWRHGISLRSVSGVVIEDVTVMSSGGDGFYLGNANSFLPRGHAEEEELKQASYPQYNENVVLRRVQSLDNHRQGLSITTGKNILVEDSLFADTQGTNPQAGIDVEPNRTYETIQDIHFRNVISRNNQGSGFEVHVGKFYNSGNEVSITFENCRVEGSGGAAFSIHGPGGKDKPLSGSINMLDLYAENTGGPGFNVRLFPATGFRVNLERAHFKSVARNGERPPFWFQIRERESLDQGNIRFVDCVLEDNSNRPIAHFHRQGDASVEVKDIGGTVTVISPYRPRVTIDRDLKTDLDLDFEWKRSRL